MSRFRLLLVSILVLILAIIGRITQHAMAAEEVQKVSVTPGKPQRSITFRDRLVVGLQARLKSEITFIDAVVTKVNGGQLPQRMVDETFFWARQRATMGRDNRTYRPIKYFRPAMKARAEKLHVIL